ncbi:MAG: hypothetical protein ATN33_07640 [Epulopiscium sp. Nele67-Bin001]|nr:MAG: hypothetical protein ATN33_07640 [Epulopiscium sp. Nele67-Bin001]
MKVLIDADACPVVNEAIEIATTFEIETEIYCDTSHIIDIEGVKTILVQKGNDAVDFVITNNIKKLDIVITQDYGLAAMVLAKGGYAINQNGFVYNENNIDQLLYRRHVHKVARKSGARLKGPKKRKTIDDENFIQEFTVLCKKVLSLTESQSHSIIN